MELPQYEDMLQAKGLKVGDKFLTGARVINQVNTKSVGDIVTFYEVVGVQKNGNVSYTQKMERLTPMNQEDEK
jgi:hypothetical protein